MQVIMTEKIQQIRNTQPWICLHIGL